MTTHVGSPRNALKYPPAQLTGLQALSISRGFGDQIATSEFIIWACAIMPDHVHLVIREHHYPVEQVVRLWKQAATRALLEDDRHPFATQRLKSGRLPSVWQQDFRKVFLYSAQDILTRINYVNNNPIEAGYKAQHWSFVAPFEMF